MTDLKKLLYWK